METFESRFSIGEPVNLSFAGSGQVQNCIIAESRFTESKVKYDIGILVQVDHERVYTVVQNVDSCFVEGLSERDKEAVIIRAESIGFSKFQEYGLDLNYEEAWSYLYSKENYSFAGK